MIANINKEIDQAISSVTRQMKVRDLIERKRKCKKCGYPMTNIGGVAYCKRCGHQERI